MILSVSNLSVAVSGRNVLRDVKLAVKSGEIHALMGPNGGGKTTFAQVLMGNSKFQITNYEQVNFLGKNLMEMEADERARAGLYVAWQNPMTIPGLNVFTLCKAACEARGKKITSVVEFKKKIEELLSRVGLANEYLGRGVNEGFSGGEKKRLELLQLLLLKPKLAILDEIDSGLDIDALKLVGKVVKEMKEQGTAFILITHYQRLLEYVKPDYVHILKDGKIVKEGGSELAAEIEEKGYGN